MKFKNIKRKDIKPYIPRRALPLAGAIYGLYMRILCWYVGLWEQRDSQKTGFARLPPAPLRYRVHGSPNVDEFLEVGKRLSKDIEAALKKIGKDFDSFQNVLDFGCGCGRTLVWLANRSQPPRLHGTDIDAEAISWCRNNLDLAEFSVNDPLPPLEYPSETFDFVYAISVFTHLDEDYQFRWLDELKRVTRPKGVVLLTVHGRHVWKDLHEADVVEVEKRGFKFLAANTMRGIFPEWYQNAYHKKDYVFDRYSKYFNILDYIPRGMGNLQDVVVLQKP
jgi:SAM-dependent methyltransferase